MANQLTKSFPAFSMVCPCCGQAGSFRNNHCTGCGARQVDEPLAKPDLLLPRLGGALLALSTALSGVVIFLLVWIFGNDMKVGRVLMVWVFGDSLKFTRDMIRIDPRLPYYNIFSYDAYRLAFYLSAVVIPLALLAAWQARRTQRLIHAQPAQFGGRRTASAAYALSLGLVLLFGAAAISSIPRAIENGRAKRVAATRATLYQLGRLLREYNEAYGRYPDDLAELQAFSGEQIPQLDYWEKQIIYSPAAFVASRDSAPGFSDYKLISAGPDGIAGTADDIILQDGLILSSSGDDGPSGLSVPDRIPK
ncbi:MAG TPA: hypothetical protein VNQ79_02075 [Blastocatellia bacterium]|nr:hypothetical protein [Blastocatellia bacterium]